MIVENALAPTEAQIEEMLPDFGGKIVFVGDVTYLRMEGVEDLWDEVAIVMYPSRTQMLKMTMSALWKQASLHRIAGIEGQLNIETIRSKDFPNAFD